MELFEALMAEPIRRLVSGLVDGAAWVGGQMPCAMWVGSKSSHPRHYQYVSFFPLLVILTSDYISCLCTRKILRSNHGLKFLICSHEFSNATATSLKYLCFVLFDVCRSLVVFFVCDFV